MNKEKLLQAVSAHISYIREKIMGERKIVEERNSKTFADAKRMARHDQVTFWNLKAQSEKRLEELTHLYGSPYFMKCELIFDDSQKRVSYYFSKFQKSDESVYSWVAPVAAIRFESPGKVSYSLPDGRIRTAELLSKEQYMIVDGHVVFFSKESIGEPRELIHQEHFSNRKTGFMLPEIVAEMEKAQDQVIRAHHKGSLVISGPAGSGKTTLAFHRVAYLVQAPDTSTLYPERSIIIFVQDNGTKEYFSHLLPELGIKGVNITTFLEWALKILDLPDYTYTIRYGTTEADKDRYEYEKLSILRKKPQLNFNARPYTMLNHVYESALSDMSMKLYERQKKDKVLDRFDLILLLQAYKEKYKKFVDRKDKIEISYSLAVIDEFQNYLPEQLVLFKQSLNPDTKSLVYVGDMAQQIHLGTIRSWDQIGEDIQNERSVVLKKVYRNTKNILQYIQKLGYDISIPEGIKEGRDVIEKTTTGPEEEIEYIRNIIEENKNSSVGILAQTHEYLEPFKNAFKALDTVHVLSMSESQGVEFDVVCIVGSTVSGIYTTNDTELSKEYSEERHRIKKDLLYVALTRAISQLHVLGRDKLSDKKRELW